MGLSEDRLGEEIINKRGSRVKIIEYRDNHDIDVLFIDDGWVYKNTTYYEFKKGKLKSPYEKTTYGRGYIGEGKYKTRHNKIKTKHYLRWRNMMQRCYDENYLKNNNNYRGCSVCEEWYNFQEFAKWYDENYYEVGSETMHLDKDILNKGNKIYSPSTCVFAPRYINNLFVKNDVSRGKLPIGVTYESVNNKYQAQCCNGKKRKQRILGYFDDKYKAFQAYKEAKELYIKEVADNYKDKIPKKLYDAMYGYEVSISD